MGRGYFGTLRVDYALWNRFIDLNIYLPRSLLIWLPLKLMMCNVISERFAVAYGTDTFVGSIGGLLVISDLSPSTHATSILSAYTCSFSL